MICGKCKEESRESRVDGEGSGTSTLLFAQGYYDEQGTYHDHDLNTYSRYYHCSNGHEFSVSEKQNCPSCDFGKDSKVIKYFEQAR